MARDKGKNQNKRWLHGNQSGNFWQVEIAASFLGQCAARTLISHYGVQRTEILA